MGMSHVDECRIRYFININILFYVKLSTEFPYETTVNFLKTYNVNFDILKFNYRSNICNGKFYEQKCYIDR